MKQMLLAVLSALCFSATAQTNINSSYFPSSGDTVRNAFIENPDATFDALIAAPGGPRTWDLSNAVADGISYNVFQAASVGQNVAKFAGADLVIIGEDAGETYFDKTSSNVYVLGYAGTDPNGLGIDVVAKFDPPINDRQAPLSLFSNAAGESSLSIPFGIEDLPDSVAMQLPGGFIDSIRLNVKTVRQEICDGFGTFKVAVGEYDVLRVRRTEYATTGLDVKLTFGGGWIDLSTLPGGGGGGVADFLGTDTTLTHRFYANGEPGEIAVLTLNNDGSEIEGIRFKTDQLSSTGEPIPADGEAPGSATITAFPNPAIEWVRFDCRNLPQDDYTIKLFSTLGKQVWKEQYIMGGDKSIRLDLDKFRKGTYFYQLVGSKGNVIGTKRLVVVKP